MSYFNGTLARLSKEQSLSRPKVRSKKRTKKPGAESSIQDSIMKYLYINGYVVVRVNSGQFASVGTGAPIKTYLIYGLGKCSGFPDILAMKGSESHLFEVKTSTGRLTVNQIEVKTFCESRGVAYNVVRSIDDVETILARRAS